MDTSCNHLREPGYQESSFIRARGYLHDLSKPEKEALLTNLVRGTGNILVENFPDEEDLTQVMQEGQNVLKFKDKIFNPEKCSGMGKVFLRKNLVKNVHDCGRPMNILTQEMFEDEHGLPLVNTVFIIQYDYDLDKGFITIPENSILVFAGGSISNGTVILRNTLILPAALDIEHFMSVNIRGSYREGSLVYLRKHLRLFDGQNWVNIGGPSDLGPKDKFEIIEFLKAYVNKCLDIVAPFKIELIPEKNYIEKGVHDIKVSWNYNRLINNQDIRLESGSKYRIYQELDKRVREYTFENIDTEDPVTIVIATTYKGETVSEAITLTFNQNPGLIIDDELNEESTNPVTNRAITAAIRAIEATLATLATKEELGEYLKKSEAADTYQPKGNYITEHQDLSEYAKSADVAANYQPKGDYQPRGNYLTEDSLNGYAKTSDLNNYALKNHTHSIDDVNGLRDALNHADTKYSLSKNGSQIVLTGTDGSTSSVSDETGGGGSVNVEPTVSPSAANAYEIAKINGTPIYGHDAIGSSGEGGDEVQWNQIKQSGEHIATITINGTATNVYASKGGSGGGDDDGQPGTILTFFLKTDSSSVPSTPEDGQISNLNSDSGEWSRNMPNSEEDKYIWMSQIYSTASGGAYGNWGYPILIYSGTGRAGSDTTDREYIYALSNVENFAVSGTCDPSALDAVQTDGFIPCPEQGDWKDNPQGISQQMRFEFISVRTKNENGWSKFTYPVLWSSYGLNGSDGDGVEYIYYAGTVPPTAGSTLYDPSKWYTNEESKNDVNRQSFNKDEYIKEGSGWTDNPQELEAGETQWVSVRKYRSDDDSESSEAKGAYWHVYSAPVVWSYYAKDAVALGALDFDNQTMGIPINEQGGNYAFVETSNAFIYKDTGASITINSLTCEGLWEGNTQIWTASKASSYVTIVGNKVTVQIPENEPTLTDISGKTYSLRFKATASGIEDRTGTIKLIGLNTGTDGRSYSLSVGAAVIRKGIGTQTGQVYPSTISPTMVTVKGAQDPEVITPTELPTNFSIRYSIDGATAQTLNSNTINVPNTIQSHITIQLVHSGQVIDQETLLVVNDGTEGISATVYNIIPLSSNVAWDNTKTSGTLTFKATRQYGSDEIQNLIRGTFGGTVPAQVKVLLDGTEEVTSSSSDEGVFTCNINKTQQYKLIQLNLLVGSSGTQMASIIIPISQAGGEGVQTLEYSVLRDVTPLIDCSDDQSDFHFHDGKTNPVGGIYYQDFVRWNGSQDGTNWGTYLCVSDCEITPAEIPTVGLTEGYFTKLDYSFAEVVSYLIANEAFINALSVNQLVVLNNSENAVVGGMTSGSTLPSSAGNRTNNNDIRIWAGTVANNGDINSAPFTVSSSGHLKATDASIKGSIDATSFKATSFKVYDTSTASESNLRMEMTTWNNVKDDISDSQKAIIDQNTLNALNANPSTPVIVVSDGTNKYILNMLAFAGTSDSYTPVGGYYNLSKTGGNVVENTAKIYKDNSNPVKYYKFNQSTQNYEVLNNETLYRLRTGGPYYVVNQIDGEKNFLVPVNIYDKVTISGSSISTGEAYAIGYRVMNYSDNNTKVTIGSTKIDYNDANSSSTYNNASAANSKIYYTSSTYGSNLALSQLDGTSVKFTDNSAIYPVNIAKSAVGSTSSPSVNSATNSSMLDGHNGQYLVHFKLNKNI